MSLTDLSNAPEVPIVTSPLSEGPWAAVWQEFMTLTGWTNGKGPEDGEALLYEEALSRCTFERRAIATALDGWEPSPDALEGRVFGGQAELRWHRVEQAGTDVVLRAWATRELADADTDDRARRVKRIDRRYFLIGLADADGESFHEARYPGVRYRYPLAPGTVIRPAKSRTFILVAEYYRTKPDWSRLTPAEIEAALGKPLLLEHRFVATGTEG